MDKGDEDRKPLPEKEPAPAPAERAKVDFHDPFARFDFEPTDGGEF